MTPASYNENAAANERSYLPYVLLALGSAAYLCLFVRVLWRIGDEGTLVYGAQRVVEGAVPCRDFIEVMAPGSFYWLALFFKLFGSTWLVTRWLLLMTGIGTVLLIYWLARRLDARSAALPAIILLVLSIPLWPAASHHWDSNLFALLSFAVFVSWLERLDSRLLFTAGFLAGVTTLFMQQKGLLLLASYLVLLWILRRKQSNFLSSTAKLSAGFITVLALVLGYFYSAGALSGFVYANIVWPIAHYHGVNHVPYGLGLWDSSWNSWVGLLRSAFSPAAAIGIACILILPFLVVAALPGLVVILALARRAGALSPAALPYGISGWALWLSEIHRKDIFHLIYGAPLLLIFFVYLWHLRQNALWRYGARALAVSTVLFAAFNTAFALAARTEIVTRRGTVHTFGKDAALDFLDTRVQPGEPVFIYPYYPMYYFLSATTNATRYSILMYHNNTDAQFREAASALEKQKVRYILWDTVVDGANLKQWFPEYQQPPLDQLVIEPYLAEHYSVVGYKNGFRVLERKDAILAAGMQNSPAYPSGDAK